MKVYLLKKEKGKKYESKAICEKALGFILEYDNEKPLGCSISDTKNYWACAIGNCGIDIEEKGRRVKESIVRSLHVNESKYMSALAFGTSEWNNEFFHIWTAKEAVYKVTGQNFKQVPVINDDSDYTAQINGLNLLFYEDKFLYLSLLCEELSFEIENIKYAGASAKPCMDYAAEILAIKAYSKADLLSKLMTKGYREDEAVECVARLEELGYLDDADYARRFAENAMQSGKGSAYIKQKLIKSGISKEDLPETDNKHEYETALELARSLFKGGEDYESRQKNKASVARKLASRGFSSSVVYKVLSDI